jgi:TPR repeat protein
MLRKNTGVLFVEEHLSHEQSSNKKFFAEICSTMASPSSHTNKDISVATLLEWYKIRDTFFGDNYVSQNIPLAIELASACQHPDARWLTRVFEGKSACSREEARRVLEAENDARGLSFAWMLLGFDGQNDLTMLRRAAELGSPLALAFLADRRETTSADRFKFALQAAAQGERHGFYLLGCCFHDGRACIPDAKKEEENLTIASELGHVWAMCELGNLLRGRPRWLWWGRAAACGECYYMLANFSKEVEAFERGNGKPDIVFAIGRALHGHVDVKARRIFTSSFDFPVCIGPAQQAVAFYEAQIQATKDAMCAWTLVGIHFNVVKDVRKLIAKLIWDAREEVLYVHGKHKPGCTLQ